MNSILLYGALAVLAFVGVQQWRIRSLKRAKEALETKAGILEYNVGLLEHKVEIMQEAAALSAQVAQDTGAAEQVTAEIAGDIGGIAEDERLTPEEAAAAAAISGRIIAGAGRVQDGGGTD